MRRFLVIGRTGVGKSSFINSAVGAKLAKTSPFEPCTATVERIAYGTAFGDVCLIDSPGLAEGDRSLDDDYMKSVKREVKIQELDSCLYLSRLNEHRLGGDERRVLNAITSHLGPAIWAKTWLVLTFAASLPSEIRLEAARNRVEQIEGYLRGIIPAPPGFKSFQTKMLVDNVTRNWMEGGAPLAQILVSHP